MTENLIALLTLFVLEIVLGIDNIIFLSILSEKLPADQQAKARQTGIGLAVVGRLLLLLSINWVLGLEADIFTLFGTGISWKDLILLVGGSFLIGKSTYEIHEKLEAAEHGGKAATKGKVTFTSVILQILMIDLVFSLDSVITAVGIADHLWVMVVAIVSAAAIMLFASGYVASFVKRHPTTKILALAFLILIGVLLVIEGWAGHAAEELHLKNYAYFAMAFSFIVEMVNIRFRTNQAVSLHNQPKMPES